MFEARQIRWLCLCGTASEKQPDALSSAYRELQDIGIRREGYTEYSEGPDDLSHLRLYLQQRDPMPDRLPGKRGNHYDAWYTMIRDYNLRVLTYETDVLSALAGLEKAMIRTHGCTYCAGLWKEDLQIGLLWYVTVQFRSQGVSKVSQPSWSWISRRGFTIAFLSDLWDCTIVDHEGITVLDFPTDDVVGSHTLLAPRSLRLRGKIRPLEIDPERVYHFRQDGNDLTSSDWISRVRDVETRNILGHINFDYDPEIEQTWRTCKVYCLLCTVRIKNGRRICTCLALVPTDDMLREFRRIGLIVLFDSWWFGLSPSTENDESGINSDNTIFRETITLV
jgi:hypothetical protein